MDRNTALACILSLLVFMAFLSYQEHRMEDLALQAEAEEAATAAAEPTDPGEEMAARTPLAPTEARRTDGREIETPSAPAPRPAPIAARSIPLSVVTLSNANVIAEISNDPALVQSWRLQDYEERLPSGARPIDLVTDDEPTLLTQIGGISGDRFEGLRFEVVSSDTRQVVQRAQSDAGVLTRTFRLDPEGYGFDLDLSFESHRSDPVDARFEVLWPARETDRPDFRELSLLAYPPDEGVTRDFVAGIGSAGFLGFGGSPDGIDRVEGRSAWAGFDTRYFTGVVIAPDEATRFSVQFEPLEKGKSAFARMTLPSVSIGTGGSAQRTLRGFFGPKDPDALEQAGQGLDHTINRGWSWLEPLTQLFEIALGKLYLVIPNYGLAIIVLTILVRLVMSPLMVRQMKSAERMREVQPKVKALQDRYKDDRQKQSEEMMKLWREEGINPLGGCFPLVFQFPVLIGLFYALQSSIGLRHAPFVLWINDLSQPATLFTLPGVDFPVRLLPLIMAGSMFLQQKMTPTTGMDPAQAKMMLVMMPAMMLFISYTFPSGLVLYWTVSNLLGIAHQYWIRKQRQAS